CDGSGDCQERGAPVRVARSGEVVVWQPGVEHWHGASPNSGFTYLAISGNSPTVWLEEVSDREYNSIGIPEPDHSDLEAKIKKLSKDKWQWMADKDVDKLAKLFHKDAQFVHMGGTWGTEQELEVIGSGGIWYKKADIHEVSVNIIDNTAILLNRIDLLAEVGGTEVTNPFMVTEVYVLVNGQWSLANLSFTRLLGP